jgi:hypothetical protein
LNSPVWTRSQKLLIWAHIELHDLPPAATDRVTSNSSVPLAVFQPLSTRKTQVHGPGAARPDWRKGDQRLYVSSCGKFMEATGRSPNTDVETGLLLLYGWLRKFRDIAPQTVQLPIHGHDHSRI